MNLPTRHMLMGMCLGALCATALAAIGPGMVIDAIADERRVGIDTASLVRFDGRDYEVQYGDEVDTNPLRTVRVKKIEAGRVSWVDIAVTSTGTYSTDALVSEHIQYPGITVSPVRQPEPGNRFSFWDGNSWTAFTPMAGLSMIFAEAGPAVRIGKDFTCVYGTGYRVC